MKFLLRNVLIALIVCSFSNAAYGESWQLVTSVSDLTDGEYLLTNVGGTCAFSSVSSGRGSTCTISDSSGISSYNSPSEQLFLYKVGAVSDPTFTFDITSVTVRLGDTFASPTLTNASASTPTYTSSNKEVATVTSDGKVTLVAPGATTITASIAATDIYPAASASYNLLITDSASLYAVRFEERFSHCKGVTATGGNDQTWNDSNGGGVVVYDNAGWTSPPVNNTAAVACECLKLASTGNDGSVTTPPLFDAQNALLTFRAGAWKKDISSFKITISGGGTLSATTVKLPNATFETFQIKIKDLTANSKITFFTPKGHRVFLDDVVVSELIAPEKITDNDMITLSGNWKQTELSALNLPDLPSGKTIDVSNLAIDGVLPLRDNYGVINTEDRTNAVSYTRNFSGKVLINGNVSWDIICLPYAVKSVMSNGITYVPYAAWDSQKNANDGFFYLKKVETGTNNITVDATSIEANTPYIIAFPKLTITGREHFYVGDDVAFTFSGDALKSTVYTPGTAMKNWNFVPNYKKKTLSSTDNVYTLNTEGTKFITATEKASVNPYRPYLVWTNTNADAAPKAYFLNGEVTAIDPVFEDKETNRITATSLNNGVLTLQATQKCMAVVYSISGSVIAHMPMEEGESTKLNLPSGVYFVNRQKVIVE